MADNAIAKLREQDIFVVLESTIGTLAAPTATDLVIGAGFITSDQQPSFSNSPEIKNSRDVLERFADKTPSGTFTLPCLSRPSGTLGTPPQESVLLKCLYGTETINASTSVVYSPAMTKPSCTIWYKKGHSVFFLRGAAVSAGKTGLATKGGNAWEFSGGFMEKGWAGTDLLDGAASSGASTVTVDDARKFKVGALAEFVEGSTTYNNSDSGYSITAVNTTTNVVTISPVLEADLADNSTIKGWLPTGTITGTPVANRKGTAKIDAVAFDLMELSLEFNDNVKYFDEEITSTGFPTAFGEMGREVGGNIKILFRENDLKYYHDGVESTDKALIATIGTTSGYIVEHSMPKTNLDVPAEEEADPSVALSMPYTALGTNGEDSISTTYK